MFLINIQAECMQEKLNRRTNQQRSDAMRATLIAAARQLFTQRGYADTATPDIVAIAGVTRGALYHHFTDKAALLAAVCEVEAEAVTAEIETSTPPRLSATRALLHGGEAYLAAMQKPGRTRLLLLDGPAVLGRAAMDEIDNRYAAQSLRKGVKAAMEEGVIPASLPLDATTILLSAAFDRAALAIEAGANPEDFVQGLNALICGLFDGEF